MRKVYLTEPREEREWRDSFLETRAKELGLAGWWQEMKTTKYKGTEVKESLPYLRAFKLPQSNGWDEVAKKWGSVKNELRKGGETGNQPEYILVITTGDGEGLS